MPILPPSLLPSLSLPQQENKTMPSPHKQYHLGLQFNATKYNLTVKATHRQCREISGLKSHHERPLYQEMVCLAHQQQNAENCLLHWSIAHHLHLKYIQYFIRNETVVRSIIHGTTPLDALKSPRSKIQNLIYTSYDNHINFHSLSGNHWKHIARLTDLFTTMIREQKMPKIQRQVKIIVLAKLGKDPHLPVSHCPTSLLSVCYKQHAKHLTNCTRPQCQSHWLSARHCTCNQATSITTFIH